MILDVWEVYQEDGTQCLIFKTEEQARNQTLLSPVSLITESKVHLSESEIVELNNGIPVWAP